jgi:hypothetical protein
MGLGSWYRAQHASVQAAVAGAAVAGCLTVVGAAVTGVFALVHADSGNQSQTSSPSPTLTHNAFPTQAPATPTPSDTPSSPLPATATISSPPDHANLPNNTFDASGAAQNIPVGDGLWLVIKPPNYHRWYPVSPISVTDNSWTLGPRIICPAGGRQNIQLFLVPNIADVRLKAYVSRRTSQHDPGINSMPSLAILEAVSRVYVKNDSKVFC